MESRQLIFQSTQVWIIWLNLKLSCLMKTTSSLLLYQLISYLGLNDTPVMSRAYCDSTEREEASVSSQSTLKPAGNHFVFPPVTTVETNKNTSQALDISLGCMCWLWLSNCPSLSFPLFCFPPCYSLGWGLMQFCSDRVRSKFKVRGIKRVNLLDWKIGKVSVSTTCAQIRGSMKGVKWTEQPEDLSSAG